MHKPLILASASPRRQEILTQADLEFIVHPANTEWAPDGLTPYDRVRELARSKATEVSRLYPDSLILGSDTMVVLEDRALGKPRDEQDAVAMLLSLQGRTHQVMTGVWLIETDGQGDTVKEDGFTDATEVDFYAFSANEAEEYVSTGEPMDKAGAYGIQGKGMRFVSGIRGDYFTVMGLPGGRLLRFLTEFCDDCPNP
ncbi:MAG: septum formation protein Maf [Clostridia bacterium]|nr:septum formation protein Maf [Clostridia bacterium]